jgi:hypothetical protein
MSRADVHTKKTRQKNGVEIDGKNPLQIWAYDGI